VLESRLCHEGLSVRRRRQCLACNYRFTTYEREEAVIFQIRKKDHRFEEFCRDKLIKSISMACTKRPVPIEKIEILVADIEAQLKTEGDRSVTSQHVGDIVMEKLKLIDHVAYVRFASIYKDFKDPQEFIAELDNLKQKAEIAGQLSAGKSGEI
jgi:transcriptional repressor NrdR